MSALAEKLPRFLRDRIEGIETRSKAWAEKVEGWVDENVPSTVVEPIRRENGLSLDALRDTAQAVSDELVTRFREQWESVINNDRVPSPVKPEVEAPAAKKPAAKKPAAKKPAAKKPAAKRSTTKKPAARKPVAQKVAAAPTETATVAE